MPFFSDLGLPVEIISKHTAVREGFTLPKKAVLLILKQQAWQERGHSLKGEKDKLDIIGLLQAGIEWPLYYQLTVAPPLRPYRVQLRTLLTSMVEIPEFNLNAYYYSKLKREVLAKLK